MKLFNDELTKSVHCQQTGNANKENHQYSKCIWDRMKKASRNYKDQVQIQYKAQCDIYQTFLFAFFQNFSVIMRLGEDKGKAKLASCWRQC